jgi:hypothetical protein
LIETGATPVEKPGCNYDGMPIMKFAQIYFTLAELSDGSALRYDAVAVSFVLQRGTECFSVRGTDARCLLTDRPNNHKSSLENWATGVNVNQIIP